jgi:hypothetical protein
MLRTSTLFLTLSAFTCCYAFDLKSVGASLDATTANHNPHHHKLPSSDTTRRNMLHFAALATLSPLVSASAPAFAEATGPEDGNLADLPPAALRSYLQYRIPLQIAADYYVFDLQDKMGRIENWGEVGELFQVNNKRGQGSPSRIERDFTNTMRILGLSMPPDEADLMRDAQFKFEKAMAMISKATAGIRRDLPVEVDKKAVPAAQAGWEDGRVALNEFFTVLNGVTGLKEMRAIPAAGPNQIAQYGRSPGRYNELVKKTKLCQNRGGPALSQGWGKLMVSGYMQDSVSCMSCIVYAVASLACFVAMNLPSNTSCRFLSFALHTVWYSGPRHLLLPVGLLPIDVKRSLTLDSLPLLLSINSIIHSVGERCDCLCACTKVWSIKLNMT